MRSRLLDGPETRGTGTASYRAFPRCFRSVALFACYLCLAGPAWTARADDIPGEYRKAVAKGLEWLAKTQHRDGHWEANGGQYPTTMTALGGMAMLMEGSTLRDGRY